jgi:uncharacterized iron-regulated membrane protein
MFKAYLLRFHRWITLLFAVPLLIVVATGLVLSFEPLMQQSALEKPLTKTDLLGYLSKFDPQGKATGLAIRSYENSLTIDGAGEEGEIEIDLTSGEVMAEENSFSWSEFLRKTRRLHDSLLMDMAWVVTASTFAMMALIVLGILMGLPRLKNTVGGWHNLAAWIALPMVILSPLTGLLMVYGINFSTPPAGGRPELVSIKEAVEILGDKVDFAGMTSLRPRGSRGMLARVYVEDGLANYSVQKSGLTLLPTNWPRALHEGTWSRSLAPGLNILVSVVFIGLWFTGMFIWIRRTFFRKRSRMRDVDAKFSPAE